MIRHPTTLRMLPTEENGEERKFSMTKSQQIQLQPPLLRIPKINKYNNFFLLDLKATLFTENSIYVFIIYYPLVSTNEHHHLWGWKKI